MPAGRPTKLTADVQRTICDAIQVGATYQTAAEYAGVDYATLRRWIERGQRGEKRFKEFCEALFQANARGKIALLAKIQKAGTADWRSAAWILERRFPEEYGANLNVDVRRIRSMSDAELVAFLTSDLGDEGAGPGGGEAPGPDAPEARPARPRGKKPG